MFALMKITPPAGEDEAAHWQRCANEARRSAEDSADQIAKKALADIAEAYEHTGEARAGQARRQNMKARGAGRRIAPIKLRS
jgi:hypothetical protein